MTFHPVYLKQTQAQIQKLHLKQQLKCGWKKVHVFVPNNPLNIASKYITFYSQPI